MELSYNPVINTFFNTVNADIDTHRPDTSHLERKQLIERAMVIFRDTKQQYTLTNEEALIHIEDYFNKHATHGIFMYRPLKHDYPLPHPLQHQHSVFIESSSDIYTNYMKTLDYLEGRDYDSDELMTCASILINKPKSRILCWSNTAILLDKVLDVLQNSIVDHDHDIITWGSPILLKKRYNKCVNLYHESDWILGFIGMLYGLDFEQIKRNTKYTLHSSHGESDFIIFAEDNFAKYPKTDPHRYYFLFS